jgi:hypothetical protein
MQQVQIPVPPVMNISMTFVTWRRNRTEQNFFQFIHGSSK